jgi:hypothetical protein
MLDYQRVRHPQVPPKEGVWRKARKYESAKSAKLFTAETQSFLPQGTQSSHLTSHISHLTVSNLTVPHPTSHTPNPNTPHPTPAALFIPYYPKKNFLAAGFFSIKRDSISIKRDLIKN